MNANRRQILGWLINQLASYLEVPAATINPMVPLAEMGVDSVHAIGLVGDVELHFDIDVDPDDDLRLPHPVPHRRIHRHRRRRAATGGLSDPFQEYRQGAARAHFRRPSTQTT